MLNSTVTELSDALAGRKISSVELTRLFLDRIKGLNGRLNAFITVDEERSLAQALVADERRSGKGNTGKAGPHHEASLCARSASVALPPAISSVIRPPFITNIR